MWGLFRFNFLVGTAAAKSEATYTLPIPLDGTYQISLLYKAGQDNASNVPVRIAHAGGVAKHVWNMRKGSKHGFSVPVGTYRFKAGNRHAVTLSTTNTDGNVIADGVGFVKVAN
jgi:hypothetical protein